MKYSLSILLILFFTFSCESIKQTESESSSEDGLSQFYDSKLKPFYHGVASGDPLPDRVIIWTRVTPETSPEAIEVAWEVSEDDSFSNLVRSGTTSTGPGDDFTVKVDVDQLSPGTRYFYRFKALNSTSPAGRTKTVPEAGVDSLKFAVASCSNYEWGYFNAYRQIAQKEDLDAVLHLGDYIYEYQPGAYGDTTIGRKHFPPHEVITLSDYRQRYSQYRLDADLRAAHQSHPFITIWDDHEIANDSYVEGAQNHQPGEGDFDERKMAARKAYYEWLPVRPAGHLYRTFSYGNLAELIMLDERLAGRTAPVDSVMHPDFQSEERTILGSEQMEWFKEQLKSSEATWKILGNQVVYSYLNYGHETFSINLDSWDGYPAEQQQIADFIKHNEIQNIIFVTGDTHSSFAFEVTVNPFSDYDPVSGQGAFAVEFGTTSINSANTNEFYATDSVVMHEKKITNTPVNPHLKYSNLRDHGYLVLSLYPDRAKADWYFVETVREPSSAEELGMSVTVKKGSNKLEF